MIDKNHPKVQKALEESSQRLLALIEEGHDMETALRINREKLREAVGEFLSPKKRHKDTP